MLHACRREAAMSGRSDDASAGLRWSCQPGRRGRPLHPVLVADAGDEALAARAPGEDVQAVVGGVGDAAAPRRPGWLVGGVVVALAIGKAGVAGSEGVVVREAPVELSVGPDDEQVRGA